MSFVNRLLRRSRIREAKRRLTKNRTPDAYAALAREYAHQGMMERVLFICREALEQFPGHAELTRLFERSTELDREGRLRELYRDLREAPRPALWRELCQILLDAGRLLRAEECAEEWFQATNDGEAMLCRAHARSRRFFSDRRREDGLRALEFLKEASQLLPRDSRPLRMHLQLALRIGAWLEARKVAARLLEYVPGDPDIESRFRKLMTLSEKSPSVDAALRHVEKTGLLVDEEPEADSGTDDGAQSLRPLLQRLVADDDVGAAVYLRGSTALVQGRRGATAERTARSLREVIQHTRTHARRTGLGQPLEIRIEGDFGTLLVAPADRGAGALWCTGAVSPHHEQAVRHLSGLDPREMEKNA